MSKFTDRDLEIFRAKQDGRTYASIGADHGLSRERVRQVIYKRYREIAISVFRDKKVSETCAVSEFGISKDNLLLLKKRYAYMLMR